MLHEALNPASTPPSTGQSLAWFCLRSQPRQEHLAARHLRQMENVEVFNPRLRFARPTRFGVIWMTEAMFPSYIFARFNFHTSLARVNYAPRIRGVVRFGERYPTVPDSIITELRARLGAEEVHEVKELAPGDVVRVAGGAFHGLEAVITTIMPPRQRVLVLMDFLGRQTTVELSMNSVVRAELRY